MIAGETEALLAGSAGEENYDSFFFGKRARARRTNRGSITNRIANRRMRRSVRKTRRIERRTARRNNPVRVLRNQRRRAVITDLGTMYRNAGRATGIGQQIDALTPKLGNEYPQHKDASKSDFSVALGTDKTTEKSSSIPKVALIAGGVAVMGIIGVMAMKKKTY